MMSLLPFFHWLQTTWVGNEIRLSTYLFPAIEVVHLLGLVVVLGPVAAICLSMLGLETRRGAIVRTAKAAEPLIRIGVSIMVCTGVLLLTAEPLKCYENPAFWYKMCFLAGALIFHFTVYRWVTSSGSGGSAAEKITAVLSLLLWFGVAVGGRLIAFL
jgi:hypothetical protein